MIDSAITVENLSKRYRIGLKEEQRDTLSGAVMGFLARPTRNFRRLQALTRFRDSGHENGRQPEDIIWALKDVSFEVKQGEVVGIIGRNGSGKSTLLKTISGITEPTAGRVLVKGRVGSLLEVGIGFHPELTGRENIYMNGTLLGMRRKEIDQKFDEIVDFSEIERFIDTPVKRYSSGMKVRLGFSVAAHLDPEIMILDEVLMVGDVQFRRKCQEKIKSVATQGRTVLLVSHIMGPITELCHWAMLLEGGRMVEQGETDQVVENYLQGGIDRNKAHHASLPPDPSKPMRLREITVLDGEGTPAGRLEMDQPFRVRVEYDINEQVQGVHAICVFRTNDGTAIFSTGDADTAPGRRDTREPGRYQGEFAVPASVLGDGKYSITVSLGIPYQMVYDRHEDIVSFAIEDHSSMRHRWLQRRWPGILGVELPWHLEKVG